MSLPRTPSFSLEGRRAIVTGAGRGIGLAAAAALADAGAQVTLVARSAGEIVAAAGEIGRGAEAVPLDVSDLAAVAAFFAERPALRVGKVWLVPITLSPNETLVRGPRNSAP